MARNTDRKAITTWCEEGLKIHSENQGLCELKTEIEAKKSQQPSVKKADVETTVEVKYNRQIYSPLNLDIAKKVGNKRNVGAQYLILGDKYSELSDFEKAIDYYKQFLGCCKKVKDRIGEGHAYCKLGDAYSSVGQVDQSEEFYKRYLSITRDLSDKKVIRRVTNLLRWTLFICLPLGRDQSLQIRSGGKSQDAKLQEHRTVRGLGRISERNYDQGP